MTIEAKNGWQDFAGANAAYLTELYDRYVTDPETVDALTRAFFERWGAPPSTAAPVVELAGVIAPPRHAALVMAAIALSTAIRMYGYRAARLDPLGGDPQGDAALLPETHGIREEELAGLPAFIVGGPVAEVAPDALVAMFYPPDLRSVTDAVRQMAGPAGLRLRSVAGSLGEPPGRAER